MKKTVILKPFKARAEESFKVGSGKAGPLRIELKKGMVQVLSLSSRPAEDLVEVRGKGRVRRINRKSRAASAKADHQVRIEVSRDWAELGQDLRSALRAFQIDF